MGAGTLGVMSLDGLYLLCLLKITEKNTQI